MHTCTHPHTYLNEGAHTVLKYNQKSKVIYKRLNRTYNTGLEPALGWGAGEKGWYHLETMYTICGRQGRISVNSSDSLHNTGPQEHVMYLMCKKRLPPCFVHNQAPQEPRRPAGLS